MLSSIFGKKIGMTQIFSEEGKSFPVTVIDIPRLFVTQVKTPENDGYAALQVGMLRKRYVGKPFDRNWCSDKKKYFLHVREIKVDDATLGKFKIGKEVKLDDVDVQKDTLVKATGKNKGKGFQGVVKRWGFGGGPSSHGSNFHRIPGSIGTICSQGKVYKGKQLPGQCGCKQITISGLTIVDVDKEQGCLFVKGAVPGKRDSLLFISKQG